MRQIVREDRTLPAVEDGETKWKSFGATVRAGENGFFGSTLA